MRPNVERQVVLIAFRARACVAARRRAALCCRRRPLIRRRLHGIDAPSRARPATTLSGTGTVRHGLRGNLVTFNNVTNRLERFHLFNPECAGLGRRDMYVDLGLGGQILAAYLTRQHPGQRWLPIGSRSLQAFLAAAPTAAREPQARRRLRRVSRSLPVRHIAA